MDQFQSTPFPTSGTQKEARKYQAQVPRSAAPALLQNEDVEQLNVGLVYLGHRITEQFHLERTSGGHLVQCPPQSKAIFQL